MHRISQQAISPVVAAQLALEGISDTMTSTERRAMDYTAPKMSLDERRLNLPTVSTGNGRKTPEVILTRTVSDPETMICDYPVRPTRTMSQQLPVPAVPRKSAARTSAIASRRVLAAPTVPVDTLRGNTSMNSSTQTADSRTEFGQDQERRREWERSSSRLTPIVESSAGTTPQSTRPSILSTRSSLQIERPSLATSQRLTRSSIQLERPQRTDGYFRPETLKYPENVLPGSEHRPERESRQIFTPSITPRDSHTPQSEDFSYTNPSPPLSPQEELHAKEARDKFGEAYRPHTPSESKESSVRSSSETGRSADTWRSSVASSSSTEHQKRVESHSQPPSRKPSLDQFDALMEDLMQEIKVQPHKPVLPPRPRASGSFQTEYLRVVSPLPSARSPSPSAAAPTPVVAPRPEHTLPQSKPVTRRAVATQTSPPLTAMPAPGLVNDDGILCYADDRKPILAGLKIPIQRSVERRTEEEPRSTMLPSPTAVQGQPRTLAGPRRSVDIRSTPSPIPMYPRIVRRSEDLRSTRAPTPTQPRVVIPLVEVVEESKPAPAVQTTKTIRRVVLPTSTPPATTPVIQTKIVGSPDTSRRPMSPPAAQSRVIRETEFIRSPNAPAPAPLQPKAARQTEGPMSPPLRPIPSGRTRVMEIQSETIRSPVSPSELKPKPSRRAEDYFSITPSTPSSATTPPPLKPRPSLTTGTSSTSSIRRIVEEAPKSPVQSPIQTPTTTSRIARRAEDDKKTPVSPAVTPFKNVRNSEDFRNPSPPALEQPNMARRSQDLRNQRSVSQEQVRKHDDPDERANETKEEKEKKDDSKARDKGKGKVMEEPQQQTKTRSDRGFRSERVETPRGFRSERVETPRRSEEEYSDYSEERSFDRSFDHGRRRDQSPVHTRSRSSVDTKRSRSTNSRSGIERCADCQEEILPSEQADSIKMAFSSYHFECLKCVHCRKSIPSSLEAHEFEGRVLCEADFAKMLEQEVLRPQRLRICTGCESPIQLTEQTVWALDKPWHEHHLCCYHCLKPIKASHMEKNGRVYCVKDYNELFLPNCNACGLKVESHAVSAQDGKLKGKWHAGCFKCQTCYRPFVDKKFYVFDDKPYCKRHYHRLNNSMCMRCDEPIEGACAQTLEGWRFHTKCFCCSQCGIKLKENYYSYDNQTYCEKDMLRIQRTRNVRAERGKTIYGEL
ncbi:Transforming growth factor beta-1-induced transcript 1 protein [Mortierella claussenii]|nr:Transforming growth factor beta-1-induced transcript 1 protein [Mortierella claussenii]